MPDDIHTTKPSTWSPMKAATHPRFKPAKEFPHAAIAVLLTLSGAVLTTCGYTQAFWGLTGMHGADTAAEAIGGIVGAVGLIWFVAHRISHS